MATFVQELTDRMTAQAERHNPGVAFTVHLSHENALLLPRTGTVWGRGGFRVEGRHVYRDCLVLPLDGDHIGESAVQLVPVRGLEGTEAGTALSYIGDLTSGEIQAVIPELPLI